MNIKLYYIKFFESLLVIALYIILRKVAFVIINRTLNKRFIQKSRGHVIKRVINTTLALISISVLLLIWGVKQADLAVFIGSVLTVVGVAFFAQWSILSNITSSIILFFNHSIKINDSIIILEAKDYVIEGKVIDIGLFFTTLQTNNSEEITLPNNIFIQKSIKIIDQDSIQKTVEDKSVNK